MNECAGDDMCSISVSNLLVRLHPSCVNGLLNIRNKSESSRSLLRLKCRSMFDLCRRSNQWCESNRFPSSVEAEHLLWRYRSRLNQRWNFAESLSLQTEPQQQLSAPFHSVLIHLQIGFIGTAEPEWWAGKEKDLTASNVTQRFQHNKIISSLFPLNNTEQTAWRPSCKSNWADQDVLN